MRRASVVIDNYNYGRFLGEAIDSALAQSYPETEVIVVDDGSTDESREVIGGYGDRIVPVLKENGGQGSALNAGFAASHGEVVVFLDADDVLLPSALSSLVPLFADPELAKVHWSMPEIDADGSRTGEVIEPELGGGDFREAVRIEGPQSDATPISAPTSGNAWARWFLEQVLPMPEAENVWGADTYLFALAPAFGRIAVTDESHSLYRRHGSNSSGAKSFAEILGHARVDLEILPPIAARPYRRAGIEVDLGAWRRHAWWGRVDVAVRFILEHVAEGEAFLLVDQDAWGTDEDFYGRRRIPFPEVDREYGGVPDDDAAAIAELERARLGGARAIFFAWPALWWLEHFEEFSRHLENRYRCVARDEVLVAFELG